MLLSKLIENLNLEIENFIDFDVKSIETDSRIINKDGIFIAIDGNTTNGINFVNQAKENGARVIVISDEYDYIDDNVVLLRCKDTRNILVQLLKKFYYNEFPRHILGITGTQGKTSVVEFIRQILSKLGYICASIGTLGLKYDNKIEKDNSLTMMEIVDLYKKLHFLKAEQNIDFVAMEITSQGLDTRRFDGLKVEIAGVTNICDHEHLDYHGNIDSYFNSKMDLLKNHCENYATVILNPNTMFYEKIIDVCKDKKYKIFTFGKNGSDIELISNKTEDGFQKFSFRFLGRNFNVNTRLFGGFQVLNLLEAFAFVYNIKLDLPVEKIVEVLQYVESADGRMKFIGKTKNGGYVYIDYAHTPSSYETVLGIIKENLKKLGSGRLISLFGLGGDRDRTKRPIMGQIAQKYSDIIIVTDDNPRTEDPVKIRNEVIAGCDKSIKNFYNFSNGREEAIKFGISLLKENDILILLGKGHENYQIVGQEKLPFCEEEIVKNNLL